jgi:hypothetical protein
MDEAMTVQPDQIASYIANHPVLFALGLFLDQELMHSGQRLQRTARDEVTAGNWVDAECTYPAHEACTRR